MSEQLTKQLLEKLYLEELLTEKEIAEKFGTYQVGVNRLRKKWGIPTLGKTGRLEALLPDVTEKQRELIVGSLLGDGWMSASSALSASFHDGHTIKYREYTDWKADVMEPFTCQRYLTTKKDGERIFQSWVMATHSCPQLRPYYDLFYPGPDRKRVFPKNLYNLMTPLVLAIWFMDDGSLHTRNGKPRIAFGLDAVSLQRAIKALRALGLKAKAYGEGGDVSIHFPNQLWEFRRLVEPHLHPCMMYKLPEERLPGQVVHRNARLLTPEKARSLYDGGLGTTQIAELFNVGVSTVSRRLHSTGLKRRSGPRQIEYTRNAAHHLLKKYDPKDWDSESGQWVDEIYDVLSKTGFPTDPIPDPGFVQKEFEKVINAEIWLTEGDEIQPNRRVGLNLCRPFFPNRYKAISKENKSAFEAWHTEKNLRQAIHTQLRYGDPVLPHRVLRAITMNCRTPSLFRPTVAKFLYKKYCKPGDAVWDPCAGYGGRLVGALAAGVRYIGTDVDQETVDGNLKLAEALGKQDSIELHCCPAEEFDCLPVDFVFTSPPYFHQEKYSKGEQQSWKQYSELDSWLEGFLRPVIERAFKASPRLALNIADVSGVPLVEETKKIAKSVGWVLTETLLMPLAALNRNKPVEPVLMFSKHGQGVPSIADTVSIPHCSSGSPVISVGEKDQRPECKKLNLVVSCIHCGKELLGALATTKYCSVCKKALGAKRAREKRKEKREANPISGIRNFTCKSCGVVWQTGLKGQFKYCPDCKEEQVLAKRQKTCQYRHCGEPFTDDSKQNSMSFCCPEHRRREKMFRSGKITGVSQFKDQQEIGIWTCSDCGKKFETLDQVSRCPDCRQKRRQKTCRTCGEVFNDTSLNNTAKSCPQCRH
jgi:DNA modification methylase